MKVTFHLLPLLITCLLLTSSCQKIVEKKLIKGTYELTFFKIGDNEQNFMEVVLPHYTSGADCCRYIVDFYENGVISGTYLVADTINYVELGTWDLKDKYLLEVHLDKYVNADLDIDRQSRRDYVLSTDYNITDPDYLGGLESPIVLTFRRIDI